MNKFFKLVYVNLLDLFDINKIIIAREDGVKSNLEKRTILVALLHVLLVYFLYFILSKMKFTDNNYLLIIGYLVSTLYCIFANMPVVEPMIFKSDDIDFLLSYPVSRNQILFSKLFTVYLKNMLMVILIMGVSFVSYYLKVKTVTETLVIMYLLVGVTVPLIPIVLATLVAYVSDYFKTKTHNSMSYKIIKYLVSFAFLGIILLLFYNTSNDGFIENLITKMYYIYPITYVLVLMLKTESIILFLIMLAIPVLCCYLYTLVISNNYLRICSLLKGVKTNSEFKLKKTKNFGKLGGLIRKEFINLFKNKPYFSGTFGLTFSLTIILIVLCNTLNISELKSDEVIELYFNILSPMVLAVCASIGCSTISSISLEKSNLQTLRTLPISMGKILLSKCLVNIIMGMFFVIVNGTVAWCYLGLGKWSIMFCFLIPFISVVFISLTGILLDYRFIEKNETEDNAILSQRLITMVPSFISLMIGIVPVFVPVYKRYALLLGAYSVILVLAIVVELLYLLINRKKLIRHLFM